MKPSKLRAWSQALERVFPTPSGQQHTIRLEDYWENARGYQQRVAITVRLAEGSETVFLYQPDLSLPPHRMVALVGEVIESLRSAWVVA